MENRQKQLTIIQAHPNNHSNNDLDHYDNHNDHNKTTKERRRIFVRQNLF